jgi:mono/diheme cytochrome c family protein
VQIADMNAGATPQARADTYFKTICAGCHGAEGKGNGAAAAALNPRPRDFTDPKWQSSVTDQHIRDTIAKGGAAVGKSALMPPQTTLANDPAELEAMVKLVRSLGKVQEAKK